MARFARVRTDTGAWANVTWLGPPGPTGPTGPEGPSALYNVTTVTADYTAASGDRLIFTNGTGIDVTLPTDTIGRVYTVSNIGSATATVAPVEYAPSSITAAWTNTQISSSSASFSSLAYGSGKFVTINGSASATGFYSSAGVSWSTSTLPASRSWLDVDYGGGKFVAVAQNSKTGAYSTDGVNWQEFVFPTNNNLQSLGYGGGKFVAIPYWIGAWVTNSGAYSTDGVTWTSMNLPASNIGWTDVAYGNGRFIVSSSNDKAIYSDDGINWSFASTMSTAVGWASVAFGIDKFVAIGSNLVAYSSTGVVWSTVSIPTRTWAKVRYGKGRFVAVANNSITGSFSYDGLTWTDFVLPASRNWQRVEYGSDRFVAVANSTQTGAYSVPDAIASTITGGSSRTFVNDGSVWRVVETS